MSKIFKFKLLIFTLLSVQPLCPAIIFQRIFPKHDESYKDYESRMYLNGLPSVGDLYETYKTKMEQNDHTCISPEIFKLFIDSVPRIYESHESINERNIDKMVKNRNLEGLQLYRQIEINYLMDYRYPRLYESYQEYTARLKSLGKEAFPHSMFKNLKIIFPNVGEVYKDYKSRMESLGLQEFTKTEFRNFFHLIPRPDESCREYLDRYNNNNLQNIKIHDINTWISVTSKDYEGFKRLVPRFEKTYETYRTRLIDLDLVPMSEDAFDFSQFLIDTYQPKCAAFVSTSECSKSNNLQSICAICGEEPSSAKSSGYPVYESNFNFHDLFKNYTFVKHQELGSNDTKPVQPKTNTKNTSNQVSQNSQNLPPPKTPEQTCKIKNHNVETSVNPVTKMARRMIKKIFICK